MYVEHARQHRDYQYYVVLETEAGGMIVTERLHNGTVLFHEENPADVTDRNSLAKALCVKDQSNEIHPVTVQDMQSFAEALGEGSEDASHSSCKHYAQSICHHARGENSRFAPQQENS